MKRKTKRLLPDWPALGYSHDEWRLIRRVAHKVRAPEVDVLAAITRIALGVPFKTSSVEFRVVDACNQVAAANNLHAS